ncbi:hypothetical protein CC86DRAFT_373666 [Ophiobolus disseminans]|uniref:Uncharacterized protein n=1 Tax=Ophiobolus disseminans TaxID=1469910 RepID=A0A6A6ZKL0_9PLEO|nr:hypothetical protein CC86DRAFT_373666 [Ophiobolus disseminans]
MQDYTSSPPKSTELAIIVALAITGGITGTVASLVALCYVTNNRRKKAQLKCKGPDFGSEDLEKYIILTQDGARMPLKGMK